jgi:hypothetical protein
MGQVHTADSLSRFPILFPLDNNHIEVSKLFLVVVVLLFHPAAIRQSAQYNAFPGFRSKVLLVSVDLAEYIQGQGGCIVVVAFDVESRTIRTV